MIRDRKTLVGAALTAACSLALLAGFTYLSLSAAATLPANGAQSPPAETKPAAPPAELGFNDPADAYDPQAIARDPQAYYGARRPIGSGRRRRCGRMVRRSRSG